MTACAGPEAQGTDPTGVDWELASGTVDGADLPIIDNHPITLSFADGNAGGTAACNGYGTSYEITGSEITFSELIWTEMACIPEEVMESEQAYLAALPRVGTFAISNDTLTLSGEGVELVFDGLPPVPIGELTGTVWVLESLVEGDAVSSVSGDRARLELFTDGSMLGSTGCRSVNGAYTMSGAEVVITEMSAQGECAQELAAQDSHILTVLGDAFRVTVDGQVLTLDSSDGLGLVYRADS
jgi:heat shock protein HslJ